MRHRPPQQLRIRELVPDPLGERLQVCARRRHGRSIRSARDSALEDVVDGITHGLEIFEILVVDAEVRHPITELFLQRLDQLDQSERVGVEVVDERLTLA